MFSLTLLIAFSLPLFSPCLSLSFLHHFYISDFPSVFFYSVIYFYFLCISVSVFTALVSLFSHCISLFVFTLSLYLYTVAVSLFSNFFCFHSVSLSLLHIPSVFLSLCFLLLSVSLFTSVSLTLSFPVSLSLSFLFCLSFSIFPSLSLFL